VDVKLVRKRLALVAATITVGGKKIQGLDKEPASINPPTFYTTSVQVDRYPDDQNVGRLRAWGITGKILVGKADDRAAQDLLDELLSDGDADIAGLLEANDTLGGACENLLVRAITDYGPHDAGGQTYLGANIAISLWAF
jgi:hypothetical protein